MQEATAPSVTEAVSAADPVADMQALVANLNAIKEQEAALHAQLAAVKESARAGVVQQIRDLIASVGAAPEEIVALLAPAKKGRKSKGTGERKAAPVVTLLLKSDPTKSYVRGVLPAWLKEAIAAAGGDPTNKKDRDSFKEQYMQAAA